jgi:hypothetical protein
MAIELIKQDMRPNEAAKKAAHHYFSHESEIVLERKIKSIGRKIRAITSSLNRN